MNENIQALEDSIQDCKVIIETGEALQRLMKNRDFKKVILEGYFKDEPIRLVHLKSDVSFQTPERQQAILTQMDSIGALNQYFNTLNHMMEQAKKASMAATELRDEMLAEDLEA